MLRVVSYGTPAGEIRGRRNGVVAAGGIGRPGSVGTFCDVSSTISRLPLQRLGERLEGHHCSTLTSGMKFHFSRKSFWLSSSATEFPGQRRLQGAGNRRRVDRVDPFFGGAGVAGDVALGFGLVLRAQRAVRMARSR